MNLEDFNALDYDIERQEPVISDGVYTQQIYVYNKSGGHPVYKTKVTLTEEEALPLIRKPRKTLVPTGLFYEVFYTDSDENLSSQEIATRFEEKSNFIGHGLINPVVSAGQYIEVSINGLLGIEFDIDHLHNQNIISEVPYNRLKEKLNYFKSLVADTI